MPISALSEAGPATHSCSRVLALMEQDEEGWDLFSEASFFTRAALIEKTSDVAGSRGRSSDET